MRDELHNESVRIRRYRREDIPLLFDAARESADESFTKWMPWCHQDYTLEEASAFVLSREQAWADGVEYAFAVLDHETGAFHGGVGLNQFNRSHGFANLGYWIRRKSMGRGLAVQATLLMSEFGFEDLGLHRIEILAAVENIRSQRVAANAGANLEGVLRNRLLIGEARHDAVLYSLIPNDLDRPTNASES